MTHKDFILATLAVFIGGLCAIAVAGLVVKDQVNQDIAATGSSPLGKLLGL